MTMPGAVLFTGGSPASAEPRHSMSRRAARLFCLRQPPHRGLAGLGTRHRSPGAGQAIAVPADVSVEREVVCLFETCVQQLGRLTALVNNAGILETQMRVEAMDAASPRATRPVPRAAGQKRPTIGGNSAFSMRPCSGPGRIGYGFGTFG
jgi:NAD(P)-dependent dehydrogenase (short-subunit alcohol dehydrogenase family)